MKRFSAFDAFAVRIRFTSPAPEHLLNEILRRNIPVWGIENGDGFVSFFILPSRKRMLSPFRKQLSEGEAWEEAPCGILRLLVLFRRRLGFFAGIFCLVLSLFLSTKYLWGIDVVGNTATTSNTVCKQLREYGLSPGKKLSDLDVKEIALRFSIDHEEYVYVGINVIGTRARVEIREREYVKEPVPSYEGASNLVARTYGRITRFEVLSGQIEVKKGDYVTEGMLLINGIRERKNGTFYPVRAVGRVFAETKRSFSVTVPFEQIRPFYADEEKTERSYEILGFSFSFPSFADENEWTEEMEIAEPVTVFGYELPIVVRDRIFLRSDEKKEVIEVDRARKLAYDKYEQFKRDTFADDGEILSENVEISVDETGVTLTAEVDGIENICREAPFRFSLSP